MRILGAQVLQFGYEVFQYHHSVAAIDLLWVAGIGDPAPVLTAGHVREVL